MFCPKCGTQNPETGKFCRSCGTDLGNVSAALTGNFPSAFQDAGTAHIHHESRRRQDPNEVFGDAVKQLLSGLGFLIVAIVLFMTGVAGGKFWWWAMLFPAFGLISKGISDYLKSKRIEARLYGAGNQTQNSLNQSHNKADLPPSQTEYVKPQGSIYDTGELVAPPSVTEDTTRHLEINKEGETMTLPKKN
jgi:hypothetical protein